MDDALVDAVAAAEAGAGAGADAAGDAAATAGVFGAGADAAAGTGALGVDAADGTNGAGRGLTGAEAEACAFGATTGVVLLRSAVWGLRVESVAACARTDTG